MMIVLWTGVWAWPAFGGGPPGSGSGALDSAGDQAEIKALRDKMERLTDIATRTFLNADYTPGMVSVLYGDELSKKGVRTVGEALELVPGVYLSPSDGVHWRTVIRGAPRSFAPGSVKILLNGAPVNGSFGIEFIPNMPVDQVDRIEVIRGPGSALYGEFACAGVIHIITRANENRVFAGAGSDHMAAAGAVVSYGLPNHAFSTGLNFQGLRMKGAAVNAGPGLMTADTEKESGDDGVFGQEDGSEGGPLAEGESEPAPSPPSSPAGPDYDDDYRKYRSGLYYLHYRNLKLNAHLFENNRDGLYESDQWGISGELEFPVSSRFRAVFTGGAEKARFSSEDHDYETGGVMDIYASDWLYGFSCDEKLIHGGAEFHIRPADRHHLLLGYQFLKADPENVSHDDAPGLLIEDDSRTVNSLIFQDEIRALDRLTVTAGLRYDHYDGAGYSVSPRIAAVFRLNRERRARRRHIFKCQYSEAFKPPSFLETALVHPAADLDFERIRTGECSYIFRQWDTVCRTTLFYSDLEARIDEYRYREDPGRFRAYGAEFELEIPLIRDWAVLDAAVSWIDAENADSGRKIGESAEWIGNAGLTFGPVYGVSCHIRERFAVDREPAWENGGVSEIAGDYLVTDLTVSMDHLFKGASIQGGVKNLFETDVLENARPDSEDWRRPEADSELDAAARWYWIKLIYRF